MIFCWQWLSEPRFQHLQTFIHTHKTHTIYHTTYSCVLRESCFLNLWPPDQCQVQTTFTSNSTLRFFTQFPTHTSLLVLTVPVYWQNPRPASGRRPGELCCPGGLPRRRQRSQGQNTHEAWRSLRKRGPFSSHTASVGSWAGLQHSRRLSRRSFIPPTLTAMESPKWYSVNLKELLPLLIPGLQFPSSTYCSFSAGQPRGHQPSMRKSSPQRYGPTLYNEEATIPKYQNGQDKKTDGWQLR